MTFRTALFAALALSACNSSGGGGGGDGALSDAVVEDATPADAAVEDATPADAVINDAVVNDAAVEDATPADAVINDAAVEDAAPADAVSNDAAVEDAAVEDAAPADAVVDDAAPADAVPTDAAPIDAAPNPDAGDFIENPYNLPITAPQTHTIQCPEGPGGFPPAEEMEAEAQHWLCTFADEGVEGHVYVEVEPVECVVIMSGLPVYGEGRGWISIDGVVEALSAASYDWGGNHHNDSIDFTRGARGYRYYHSSFGWGWRQCQEMDCMQINDDEGALLEDGCTAERTLPVVCRQILSDGTWRDMIDDFSRCPGDPNGEG